MCFWCGRYICKCGKEWLVMSEMGVRLDFSTAMVATVTYIAAMTSASFIALVAVNCL